LCSVPPEPVHVHVDSFALTLYGHNPSVSYMVRPALARSAFGESRQGYVAVIYSACNED
jgi:hypothetical protein